MYPEMKIEARAKWNLTLDVLGLRADGYHEVASVMQSLVLSDRLTVTLTAKGTEVTGGGPAVPRGEDNLVYHAVEALRRRVGFSQGVRVEIEKAIPVAAGLGGGSSDAAAVLLALNWILELGLTAGQLLALGGAIGSDVPFCLLGGTILVRGRGERLTVLPAPPVLWLVLARPPLNVSTARVYRAWDELRPQQLPATGRMVAALAGGSRNSVVAVLSNHLEVVTFTLHPELAVLKRKLLEWGAEKVLLCGSGPTLAAIVPGPDAGRAIARRSEREGYETWLTHTQV